MGNKPGRVQMHTKRGLQEMQPQEDCFCGDPMTDRPTKRLSCKHTMHRDCWQNWQRALNQVNKPGTCPTCRAQVGAPPEVTPEQADRRQYRGVVDNWGAYQVGDADRALMRLTVIVGDADDVPPETAAAMVRILRVFPSELVTAIAEGNAPDDLPAAIRQALEGVNPGHPFAAYAVEAREDQDFVPMMANVLGDVAADDHLLEDVTDDDSDESDDSTTRGW